MNIININDILADLNKLTKNFSEIEKTEFNFLKSQDATSYNLQQLETFAVEKSQKYNEIQVSETLNVLIDISNSNTNEKSNTNNSYIKN